MSYEQYLKHSRNHRKDRFVQQCSGYGGTGDAQQMTDEQFDAVGLVSFQRIVYGAAGLAYPIFVVENGGFWSLSTAANSFATEIDSFEALLDFGEDYVEGFSKDGFGEKSVDDRLADAHERSLNPKVQDICKENNFEKE